MNILEKVVASKKQEIERLHEQYDLESLRSQLSESLQLSESSTPDFYRAIADTRTRDEHFFIAEFKRKSPSEGWINRDADLPVQVRAYVQAGANAVSVLTDESFFGGSYPDLKLAAETRRRLPSAARRRPLLLQKDFILDPIQIYLAKLHGADIILLIAAILEPVRLDFLKKTAESLGLGVIVEVHDAEELAKIQHLDFPVLGVNNRDLKTFRTALNRVNFLTAEGGRQTANGEKRFVISESGIRDCFDFQVVRNADGFLIGTSLMRGSTDLQVRATFGEHFQSHGKLLFKACGIRTTEMLATLTTPDFIGINFSPVSKRRINVQACEVLKNSRDSNAVAVFYKNTESEIRDILEKHPFRSVQLYADDVSPAFVRSLKQRVILALQVHETTDLQKLEPYTADVDFFILDGATPGSGQRIGAMIPADFPYPFLLAGGLNEENLEAILDYENCIGVDIASGIETDGQVDLAKIEAIARRLLILKEIVCLAK